MSQDISCPSVIHYVGQNANVGMLPPSESEEESEEEQVMTDLKSKRKGTASMLPTSRSEEGTSTEEEESDSEDEPQAIRKAKPAVPDEPAKRKIVDEPDPEQVRKDLARLEMIKQKREQERIDRIKKEGYDRFAPSDETNVRPDLVPKGYPGKSGIEA